MVGPFTALLLFQHLVENRDDPVFESAVIVVWDNEITDAVQTLLAQVGAWGAEGSHVCVAETFDEVLLNATSSGDDGGNVLVLNQPAEDTAEAGRDEIGGVA